MIPSGGGSYPPFPHQSQPSHQGINPAMLASYNQPQQQQQPNQYGGGGVSGGMNSFMHGGGPNMPGQMPGQMNLQMQQPQQITPQMLQLLANAGITREQLAGMNPIERQTAVREAMVAMRQRQIQNQQAQQQHFLPEQGSYDRPGSAMGMGMRAGSPMAPGMNSSEYQQSPNPHQGPPQNGFPPKHAPPHFGPGPGFGNPSHGMPQQQQPPPQQQNPSLPPSDPQPQVLRSNSMGPPPHMLRSSSASGSQPNGYPQPNGGPHRPPQFGPQAHTPQRQASIPRSISPIKRAPSTPVHTEAPVPSAAPGPAPATVPSLPPLPASVNLNPAVTRVTVVPLSTSLAAIPPVEAEEVKKIQEWMEVDRKYENVYREMKTRMGAEHRELMGPAHIPWWEQGTFDMNASRFLHGREKFEVRYPYRKRDRDSSRRKAPKREGLKLPRKLDPEDANRPEELVPIRLEFDVDHHKVRDTFVWNMNACVVSPEHFAQTVVEDYNLAPFSAITAHSPNYDGDSWNIVRTNNTLRQGTLEGESAQWWGNWRKRLRTEYGFVRAERNKRRKLGKVVKDKPEDEQPMSVEEFTVNNKTLHEDMRILIRLDIIVGSIKLDDQFEWDLDSDDASPEDFAEIYAQELGLGGEFKTAIVHSIRAGPRLSEMSVLVGHTMDGTPVEDDDLRNSFLPSLSTGARSMDQVQAFTPLLNYLSDGELERHEKERDKEFNKRRKKNRGGRRALPYPTGNRYGRVVHQRLGSPSRTRDACCGRRASAPMSRRAAAAAASVTIANLVASENASEHGDSPLQPMYRTSSLPTPHRRRPLWFFKPPAYDPSILRPRAKVPAPIPSTAADVSKLPAPLENDPPPPPSAAAVVAVTAKRAKELERSAKEKEFAEGQQQNMINGVWHCSNCGCPESIAVGRRKGPLGDKSQCGTCGKFWHRYRKPRPVEYNSDYDFHANGAKKEAEVAKRKKGRPPSSANAAPTRADTSEPPTPRDSGEGPSRQSPIRDVSPISTASTASEMPLAQRIKINHTPSTPPPSARSPVVASTSVPPPSAPTPPSPPLLVCHLLVRRLHHRPRLHTPPAPAVPLHLSPPRCEDKFEVLPKATAVGWEWRLKCLDCPGKLYITGGGETLNNYELHLKNRLHRRRVNDRILRGGSVTINSNDP
ncbi:hypothetical protein B0H14DRAFT_2923586 [Mycena olivaceomarginata]|nr:hypothetical protein B0H14DRAFT_2923586 [Mycena olivaceomarginata]